LTGGRGKEKPVAQNGLGVLEKTQETAANLSHNNVLSWGKTQKKKNQKPSQRGRNALRKTSRTLGCRQKKKNCRNKKNKKRGQKRSLKEGVVGGPRRSTEGDLKLMVAKKGFVRGKKKKGGGEGGGEKNSKANN